MFGFLKPQTKTVQLGSPDSAMQAVNNASREILNRVTSSIMKGQEEISWGFIRSCCSSNIEADNIAALINQEVGLKIRYKGVVYEEWT